MRILIAPDKFKGSLTSFEVCDAIRQGIVQSGIPAEVVPFPMADGGDGFAAAMKHYLQTETVACHTVNALGGPIIAHYEWQQQTKTAIIELASASGLAMLGSQPLNIMQASTFGTGLMIAHAIQNGAEKIILGLGGSATNDAGTGILAALGFTFLDAAGNQLPPGGASLARMASINIPSSVPSIAFEVASDVSNMLYGPAGAAFVFASQKGATTDEIKQLDAGLQQYASVIWQQTAVDVGHVAGAGAAGGVVASLITWFPTTIQSGAAQVIRASHIHDYLANADYLVTGEGKLDAQSLHGKLVATLTEEATKYKVPVLVLCGICALNEPDIRKAGIQAVYSLCKDSMDLNYCIQHAKRLLQEQALRMMQDMLK